jgi:hypothetical protein
MRDLAEIGIVGGESGVAGFAAFRLAARDPRMRAALRLDAASRVLLFGTEGATDPAVYARIVGRSAEEAAGKPLPVQGTGWGGEDGAPPSRSVSPLTRSLRTRPFPPAGEAR